MKYLILRNPGHNRVYYTQAAKLAIAELEIASTHFSTKCKEISHDTLGGISYISVELEKEMNEEDILIVSKLSFIFALYQEIENADGRKLLNPIELPRYEVVNSKISNLIKYKGKTNEIFTRMMINVGIMSIDINGKKGFDFEGKEIKLLDPVAGRGTTLFESAIYGYSTYGIEIEKKSTTEAQNFFKKFLKQEKWVHSDRKYALNNGKNGKVKGIQYMYAHSRAELKEKQGYILDILNGDAQDVGTYFKGNSIHLIVGDLPYGIVHANKSAKGNSQEPKSPSRNPSTLIEKCIPGWFKVLKKGGVVVLAWNSYTISREDLSEVFEAKGFEVLDSKAYSNFEHMVDQSIKRDLIIARKK